MFRKLLLVLPFSFLFITTSQAQSAIDYLQKISNEFDQVSREMMSYMSAASHGKSAKKVDKRRQDLLNQLKLAKASVRKMKPFQNDATLRDTVVEYFDLSYLVMNEDFGKVVDMEEIAEQSYDAMEAYLLAKEKAGDKLEAAQEKVNRQEGVFAKANNINLIQGNSAVGQKLETSSKVFNYYNRVYLIFFKSFKDEAYLLEAFSTGTIASKEQSNQSLLTSSSKGLEKLGPMSGFKGDLSLKNHCQQLLIFYKEQAQKKVPFLIEFELKKENFEKMKAAFEAKKVSNRTQADITSYNNAIKEFNTSLAKVNTIQNELNKKRSSLLDNWNRASNQFLDEHVPKYR